MADETKLRVNCFVNDGRKLNGRRAVLNKRWHWKQCDFLAQHQMPQWLHFHSLALCFRETDW